jgi:hypothetical protein
MVRLKEDQSIHTTIEFIFCVLNDVTASNDPRVINTLLLLLLLRQRRRSVDKLPIDNQALCSELQTRECAVGIRRKNTKIKVVEAEMH